MSAFCSKYPKCGCVGIGTKCYDDFPPKPTPIPQPGKEIEELATVYAKQEQYGPEMSSHIITAFEAGYAAALSSLKDQQVYVVVSGKETENPFEDNWIWSEEIMKWLKPINLTY